MSATTRSNEANTFRAVYRAGSGVRCGLLGILALLVAGCSGVGDSAVVDYLIGDSKPEQPSPAPAPAAAPSQASGLVAAPKLEDVKESSVALGNPNGAPQKVHIPKGTQRVIVVVNDLPITDYDVTLRMRLNQVLRSARGNKAQQRKEARKELIDDVIKRAEAKRLKIIPTRAQIDGAINSMAQGSGMSVDKLKATLAKNGIPLPVFRQFVSTNMAFRGILSRRFRVKVNASEAEVDRRYQKLESDPRLKPVKVYLLQEITLPVEQTSQAMYPQLLQARAVEAQQIIQRYRGCRTARRASAGIYNVKVGRTVQAPEHGLPPQMKRVLDKAGPGRLLGPMRAREGIRLIGFCGRKLIKPPKPSRQVVKNMVLNEKFKNASERAMRDLRRRAFVDYKDRG